MDIIIITNHVVEVGYYVLINIFIIIVSEFSIRCILTNLFAVKREVAVSVI